MKRIHISFLLSVLVAASCAGPGEPTDQVASMTIFDGSLSDVDSTAWDGLAERRIFFGHQSVGRNILDGVRRLVDANPQIGLSVVSSTEPAEVHGPALIEGEIGENRYPETKDAAFASALKAGFGDDPGAVAMYKYCYVDMGPQTDPNRLFEEYAAGIERLREEHPGLAFVHFTMPLHQVRTGLIERIATRIGRLTNTALNLKRNRYNELLRQRYGGVDPVFDLALIESTRDDGTRAYSSYKGERVYMLAPEWTEDGGHLTERGQDRAAEQFLVFLADHFGYDRGPGSEANPIRTIDASH